MNYIENAIMRDILKQSKNACKNDKEKSQEKEDYKKEGEILQESPLRDDSFSDGIKMAEGLFTNMVKNLMESRERMEELLQKKEEDYKKSEEISLEKEEDYKKSGEILQKSLLRDDFFPDGIKIDKTKIFPTVVLATMSSGKSTLINALLGKEILPSCNEACTALTYSILDDDSDAKEVIYTTDRNGKVSVYEDNLAEELLRINTSTDVTDVFIRSHIDGVLNTDKALLIIDTPGPNNSCDASHQDILFNTLKKIKGGLFLYVLNATQLGIYDDRNLLTTLKCLIEEDKNKKILFVLNKIDQLDEERGESIEDCVQSARKYISTNGFLNPEIIPVSARAALLFKKVLNGEQLTRRECREFCSLYRLYESKDFNMRKYAVTEELNDQSKKIIFHGIEYTIGNLYQAIENTGIGFIEDQIQKMQIRSSGQIKNTIKVRNTKR